MIFLWNARNEEHIEEHAVSRAEAEYIVDKVKPPYPEAVGGDKQCVWGPTRHGRFLQVIFVPVLLEDVEADEFQRLDVHDRIALQQGEPAVRVIHARELTDREKRRLHRRQKG
jgi:uncharacterized DUF497 family protein